MDRLKTIAVIHNDFVAKFGIPFQSGIVEGLESCIVFERAYSSPDAVRGLEAFSHIWLIWGFSQGGREGWSATVRPPRLGGNTRVGVFATRSPYRPNAIGLSCVRLSRIEHHPGLGPVLHVEGADLLNGTPIYDIKPYLPFADSRPDAISGFSPDPMERLLRVEIADEWRACLPDGMEPVLIKLLEQDPRPSYQEDPQRVYGMEFGAFEVKFAVDGDVLTVVKIEKR